ncbi:hypothetical protein ACFL15_01615 [Patescibacteria group bacterium]
MFTQLKEIMGGVGGGGNFSSASGAFSVVASVFVVVGFGTALVAAAISFILFATSVGDKDNIKKAQDTLLWAGLGMIISLLAYVIKDLVMGLF